MSEPPGRHAADDSEPTSAGASSSGPAQRGDGPGNASNRASDSPAGGASTDSPFARPSGVDSGFADREPLPAYVPPPPTVAPQDAAVFGRPEPDVAFAPAPGERIAPRPTQRAAVPRIFTDTFGATPNAREGFDPAPGTRLDPGQRRRDSPWWKPDAVRDPWRDPGAPFWLGRGAVFDRGRPAQLDPYDDTEAADDPAGSVGPAEDGGTDEDLDAGSGGTVRRVRFGLPTIVATLVIAIVAGLIGGGVGWFVTRAVGNGLHDSDVSIAKVETPTQRPAGSVAGVAKRVGPAVVSIAVKTSEEFGIGSGVVIEKQGYVLTNNHVVAPAVGDKSASIVVTFSNEATAKAQIVGTDPESDLAVIKVPDDQLTVAQLGDSDKLAPGDQVIAIGSPLGLQGTVTAGIVSALNRPVKEVQDDGTPSYLSAIQTDAPINPGNSGGALVNSSGAVIGINSAGRFATSDAGGNQIPISGIGYAIPINHARDVAQALIRTGKVEHAGIGAQGVTALSGLQVGGYLKQVSPGGPAAKAGLRPGDVVVAADKQAVQTFDQLVVIVQQHQPGDRIDLTYYRGNDRRTTTVTLGNG